MSRIALAAAAAFAAVCPASAHPAYVALLPNGAAVPGYAAIGHVDPAGGGARNVFGQQFWDVWGETRCSGALLCAPRPNPLTLFAHPFAPCTHTNKTVNKYGWNSVS